MMQGKKGVWLKLPLEKCDLVPVAVKVFPFSLMNCSQGISYYHFTQVDIRNYSPVPTLWLAYSCSDSVMIEL